jgi:hypothetical protein
VFAHEINQVSVPFENLLTRTGSSHGDVTREREGPATEMHSCDGLPRHSKNVDDMPDSADVLEEEIIGRLGKDVRLRRAVYLKNQCSRLVWVGHQYGSLAGFTQGYLRVFGHVSSN